MIIETVLDVLFNVFKILTMPIAIPTLPDNVMGYIDTFFTYMESGVSLLANYTEINYLLILFSLLIAVDLGIGIYHFVMWVIKKIPFLSME